MEGIAGKRHLPCAGPVLVWPCPESDQWEEDVRKERLREGLGSRLAGVQFETWSSCKLGRPGPFGWIRGF